LKIVGEDYSLTTLDDLKNRYVKYEFHAKLRGNSRQVYKKSGKPMMCVICGYSKHVDVCHLHPISDFPLTCTISEVNALSNLVTLCKNHHWEFDNDELSPEDSATLSAVINKLGQSQLALPTSLS